MLHIDRRQVLLSAAAAAGIAAIAGCAKSGTKASEGRDILAPFLQILFPQPGVAPSVYDDIALKTRKALEARADWPPLQAEGAAALDKAAGGNWLRAKQKLKISAAEQIGDTAFFRTIYQTALVEFYSDPRVWAAVGYPGASAQNGGYLHNGFDDIDWLPETAP